MVSMMVMQGTGEGVNVYVISAGVNGAHAEFAPAMGSFGAQNPSRRGSRVVAAYSTPGAGAADVDVRGEGTAAAALVAGLRYGVARGATVHSVKVFADSESEYAAPEAQVLAGVRWVVVRQPAAAV